MMMKSISKPKALGAVLFLLLNISLCAEASRNRRQTLKGVRVHRHLQVDEGTQEGEENLLSPKDKAPKEDKKDPKDKTKDPKKAASKKEKADKKDPKGSKKEPPKKKKCKKTKGPVPEGASVEEVFPVPPEEECEEDIITNRLDCNAIATDNGPIDSPWISFVLNADIVTEPQSNIQSIYAIMEDDLQENVAPAIAGCEGRRRKLQTTDVVNVDFRTFAHDENERCQPSIAMEASNAGDNCLATDIPLSIYYDGDLERGDIISRIRAAMNEHGWSVAGVNAVSINNIAMVASSEDVRTEVEEAGGLPAAAVGGVAAVVLLGLCGFLYYRKNNNRSRELDMKVMSDTESDTDEEKERAKKINSMPVAVAKPIYNIEENAVEVSAQKMN